MPQDDYAATRSTFTSSINSSNVNTLGVAWTMPLTGGTSTTPIIMGNNVFLQDNAYNIWSVDFNTGKVNWYNQYNLPWIGPTGVCAEWGKVFATTDRYNLATLDMNTGKMIWNTKFAQDSNSVPAIAGTSSDYMTGQGFYNLYCAQCHGANGTGDGQAAATSKGGYINRCHLTWLPV